MNSSVEFQDENGHVQLDLALSIGGTFRSLPEKSTASGSSFSLFIDGDEEESGVTDAAKDRGEIRAKRNREDDGEDGRNPPLKREKKLRGVGSECNVDREDSRNKPPVQMPYPYSSSLQYVPFFNGYAFPYVVPYWAVGHGGERTVLQPVACRSFTPFEGNRKTGSSGLSPVCSSSVVSDNNQSSSSHEGGGSSYTRSNSCNSSSDRHQTVSPNPNPNANDSMNHVKPKLCSENKTQCGEKFVESQVSKTTTIKKEPQPIMASNKEEAMVPKSKSVKCLMKNTMKMENGKPPKPQILQSHNVAMPCVSTTGVGPDGKTITGFLYRYSNLEVSILCVCHGESFSPAEFVKHAGGGDVSNPLRHITVLPTNGIPSAIR